MDSSSLWSRRSNKLALSTSSSDKDNNNNNNNNHNDHPTRNYNPSKRFGSESSSQGRGNPFNGMSPLSTANISTPTPGASSAFGLGSGAFASFGSTRTPKSPGNTLDLGASAAPGSPFPPNEKREKRSTPDPSTRQAQHKTSTSSLTNSAPDSQLEHPLKHTWVIWYRPPTSKNSDYEKSTVALASFSSVESFWAVYSHMKRPSSLPSVSDYHLFKKGVRPVWEDKENRKGGKWIIKLKKGVADRYWEDLLLGIVGDQFAEASDEVCGAVLSVRGGEDVLSVWTRIDGGRNIKIRETVKRLLGFPPDTNIIWKSHDESIAQRSALDLSRQEKQGGGGSGSYHSSDKRNTFGKEDGTPDRNKAS
ncbi:MAG: hypothetical protein M4579_003049 [Chaenotheca gracillima]|nr:MAG: hypothetical protein M4579_003049 [Chaenotheca gracillima]